MMIGEALGGPFEGMSERYPEPNEREMKSGFEDIVWQTPGNNVFKLKPGQWAMAGSLGLCLADSLLVCGGFNGLDLKYVRPPHLF